MSDELMVYSVVSDEIVEHRARRKIRHKDGIFSVELIKRGRYRQRVGLDVTGEYFSTQKFALTFLQGGLEIRRNTLALELALVNEKLKTLGEKYGISRYEVESGYPCEQSVGETGACERIPGATGTTD
jgi:hypothetical protein